MATGDRNDPYAGHHFVINIENVGSAGFSECTGLTMENDPIEYREGSEPTTHVRKIPGLAKYGNITFKRGFTKDMRLWNWRNAVIEGKTQRSSGTIILRDEQLNPVLTWKFFEAWPSKLEGPNFNAKTNDIAIETLTIVVEWLQVE